MARAVSGRAVPCCRIRCRGACGRAGRRRCGRAQCRGFDRTAPRPRAMPPPRSPISNRSSSTARAIGTVERGRCTGAPTRPPGSRRCRTTPGCPPRTTTSDRRDHRRVEHRALRDRDSRGRRLRARGNGDAERGADARGGVAPSRQFTVRRITGTRFPCSASQSAPGFAILDPERLDRQPRCEEMPVSDAHLPFWSAYLLVSLGIAISIVLPLLRALIPTAVAARSGRSRRTLPGGRRGIAAHRRADPRVQRRAVFEPLHRAARRVCVGFDAAEGGQSMNLPPAKPLAGGAIRGRRRERPG